MPSGSPVFGHTAHPARRNETRGASCGGLPRAQGIVFINSQATAPSLTEARPAGRQPPRATPPSDTLPRGEAALQMAAEPADEDVERHVRKRFEVCQRLGKGAYGVVWKAIERRSRSTVALKKCFDAFRNGAISASRGAAAPSRHRRASSPGMMEVGGFFFYFERVSARS